MPLMRVIWSPPSPCIIPGITGTPPATAAPCTSCTPCFAASRASVAPRYAISCLLAVTTDLPAAKHFFSQPSAGSSPPISSTTISARELRMSSKFSVHTTDAGTHFAAADARLRSTLRLKMCVSSTPGSFDSAITRATELPTVPNPSSAIFTGAPEASVVFVRVVTAFRNEVLRLIAMSVIDSIGKSAPCVEALHRLVGQQTRHGDSALVERAAHLLIEQGVVEAGIAGVCRGVAIKNRVAARPEERGQAHRAGLATGVDHASGELKVAQSLARSADRDHFGMGRGVVGRRHQVGAGGDDLAIAHHHRAKRASAAGENIPGGQRDRSPHEDGIAFDCLASSSIRTGPSARPALNPYTAVSPPCIRKNSASAVPMCAVILKTLIPSIAL